MIRRFAPALFLILLWPAPVTAQVKVSGQTTYKPYDPIVLQADGGSAKSSYLWDVSVATAGSVQVVESGGTCYVWASPGSYRVQLIAIDFESKKVERARFTFSVSGDVPPGPGPGPTPPGPGPGPPQPVAGLTVLILYESAEEGKMPKSQQAILRDPALRVWLNAHCAPSTEFDGGKAWAIWDKDVDASAMSKLWQDWLKRPRASVPWIIVGNATGVAYEGPLPADTAATIAFLSKYVPAAPQRKAA